VISTVDIPNGELAQRNLTHDQRAAVAHSVSERKKAIKLRERAKKAVDAREAKAGRKTILSGASADKINRRRDRSKESRRAAAKEAPVPDFGLWDVAKVNLSFSVAAPTFAR
jgi:hypothetical protein